MASNIRGLLSRFTSAVGQSFRLVRSSENVQSSVRKFSRVTKRQFQCYAAQRIRRGQQMYHFYRSMYGDRSKLLTMVVNLARNMRAFSGRPATFALLGSTLFTWKSEGVDDASIDKCIDDLNNIRNVIRMNSKLGDFDGWELVIDQENLKLWKKPIDDTAQLYQYKVYGRFYDVSAASFFKIQMDTDYRKTWDDLVLELSVVDSQPSTGTDVLYWRSYFPYPMYPRDYVFVRRHKVDEDRKVMVLINKSVVHPHCPESSKTVRVRNYSSEMVIRPHSGFDDLGLDYVLTYFDDPNVVLPTACTNYLASTGIPDYVAKLHRAAKSVNESQRPPTEAARNQGKKDELRYL